MSTQATTQKTPIIDKGLDAQTIKKLWVKSITKKEPTSFMIPLSSSEYNEKLLLYLQSDHDYYSSVNIWDGLYSDTLSQTYKAWGL